MMASAMELLEAAANGDFKENVGTGEPSPKKIKVEAGAASATIPEGTVKTSPKPEVVCSDCGQRSLVIKSKPYSCLYS